MKKLILLLLLFPALTMAGEMQKITTEKNTALYKEAVKTTQQLKKTSPFLLNNKRINLMKELQNYTDCLSYVTFEDYLVSSEEKSVEMEKTIPILYYYRDAFDTILKELQNTKTPKNSVTVWVLYNMGIIVRSPSGCYGIDINHRWAEKLEPYLDFICVTHNHDDHKSEGLMQAMRKANKPVLSNFFKEDEKYCSTTPNTYKIGNFSVRTDITDHNKTLLNFVSVFRVEGDGFSILHCGDSNFVPKQYVNTAGKVNLLVFFSTESVVGNQIIGTNLVMPDYVAMAHFTELRHRIDSSPRRYPLIRMLNGVSSINCKKTILPLWGEKLVWKAGRFK